MVTFAALLTAVLYWLFLCHCLRQLRDRARRRAGPLLRKWPPTHSRVRRIALLAVSAGLIWYLTSHLCDMVDGGGWFMVVLAWFNVTSLFWVFSPLLLPVVEFREGGILEFNLIPLFMPWAIVEYCATAASGNLQVRTGNRGYLLSKKCIPAGKIAEATEIVCRYVEVRDAQRGVRRPEHSAADRPAEPEPARSEQGRFQFSLRSLLFFVLVASSAMSLYGIRYRRDASERDLLAQLARFQPDMARIGSGFVLGFSASPVKPGNQEMEIVSKLSRVKWLELGGTPITDAGLARLKPLVGLDFLDLSGTAVTDGGLKQLESFAMLGRLELSGTAVTDAGLVHLEKLKSLRYVGLRGTRVTASGLKRLRQALPGVEIAR